MGFFANEDPSGDGLAEEILQFFDRFGIKYDDLEVVGMDGTTANTGYKVRHLISKRITSRKYSLKTNDLQFCQPMLWKGLIEVRRGR